MPFRMPAGTALRAGGCACPGICRYIYKAERRGASPSPSGRSIGRGRACRPGCPGQPPAAWCRAPDVPAGTVCGIWAVFVPLRSTADGLAAGGYNAASPCQGLQCCKPLPPGLQCREPLPRSFVFRDERGDDLPRRGQVAHERGRLADLQLPVREVAFEDAPFRPAAAE